MTLAERFWKLGMSPHPLLQVYIGSSRDASRAVCGKVFVSCLHRQAPLFSRNIRRMLVVADPAFADSTLNPYNSLLYAQIQAHGQRIHEFSWRRVLQLQLPDLLHVHWPQRQVLAPRRHAAGIERAASH